MTVYERTAATALRPGVVVTDRGEVRAPVVVRATEAYTPELPGQRRAVLPIYSLIVATAPLPAAAWAELGWAGCETLTDGRHLLVYAQRTADGRVAFGGRGAPYHLRSAHRPRVRPGRAGLRRAGADDAGAAAGDRGRAGHAPLGRRRSARTRDWFPSVGIDRGTGLAWAGGYVGDGVGTANLAGRTLADLILRRDTALTRLPWVGHRSRRWEPEPLRWAGATAVRRLADGGRRGRGPHRHARPAAPPSSPASPAADPRWPGRAARGGAPRGQPVRSRRGRGEGLRVPVDVGPRSWPGTSAPCCGTG